MEQEANPEVQLSLRIADTLRNNGFDEETCTEVGDMDFPDAFEAAYGYLTQADLDPDGALAEFTEEPEG